MYSFFWDTLYVIFWVTGNHWLSRSGMRQAQTHTLFSFNLEENWRKSDHSRKYSGKTENVYYSLAGSALCRVGSSWLCLNEDLRWTPRSPHSAADSQHSHFLREGGLLSFLSLPLFTLYLPPSPSPPPLIILHSRGVIVALCVHCLMLF